MKSIVKHINEKLRISANDERVYDDIKDVILDKLNNIFKHKIEDKFFSKMVKKNPDRTTKTMFALETWIIKYWDIDILEILKNLTYIDPIKKYYTKGKNKTFQLIAGESEIIFIYSGNALCSFVVSADIKDFLIDKF